MIEEVILTRKPIQDSFVDDGEIDIRPVVAITGTAGYIGSVLVEQLRDTYRIIGIDRNHKGDVHLEDGSVLYQASVGDDDFSLDWYTDIELANEQGLLKGIVHLAADSLITPSFTDPMPMFMNNVGESMELLHFVRNLKVPFIFMSSAAVYGDAAQFRMLEHEAGNTTNPYGESKWQFEQILKSVSEAYGTSVTVFRPFNVIGATKKNGQNPDYPHIITSLCRAAYTNNSFVIDGNNYNTWDGTQIRDYIHVLDVCEAIRLRLEAGYKEEYEVFNLGSARQTSNLDLAILFKKHVEPSLEIEFGPRRKNDPEYLVSDSLALWGTYGWSPQYTLNNGLDVAIKESWEYYISQLRKNNTLH